MKTITIDYDLYCAERIEATAVGVLTGRENLRRELSPVLDELMNMTRLESTNGALIPGAWSLPMSGCSDAYRRKIRELMVKSGLFKA